MDISKPTLTEPGVKYFLKETLKNCRIKKNIEFNQLMNLALLTSFVVISSVLLYYKYKTRPSDDDRKNQQRNPRDKKEKQGKQK